MHVCLFPVIAEIDADFFIVDRAAQRDDQLGGDGNRRALGRRGGRPQRAEAGNDGRHDKARATFEHGVLTLQIPKAELTNTGKNPTDAKATECINKLVEALDSYIPEPERDVDKPFLMPIEDVFTITGRGTVVTGRIEQGKIESGNEVEIVGIHEKVEKTVVTGLEMFQKTLDYAQAGDNAGALLRGIKREDIERGQVLAKPGSITPHTLFKAEVYVLSKDEGGRHTPFFNNYRPQFYFRTTDVTGAVELPKDKEMVMPGDNVTMDIALITPIAMEKELRFAIREGGRTVGAGVVAEIAE